MSKPSCEIKHTFACINSCIRQYQGRGKDDPKFYACVGCAFYLKRQGVKMKEVK